MSELIINLVLIGGGAFFFFYVGYTVGRCELIDKYNLDEKE